MGLFSSIISLLIKCGVVVIGAFFLAFFATLPFSLMPLPKELLTTAKMLVFCCFALALASLIFARNAQAAKMPLKAGFLISGILAGAGLVFLLVLKAAYPVLIASIAAAVFTLLYTDNEFFRTHDLKDRSGAAGYEVTEIPRAYLKTTQQVSPPNQSPINHAEGFSNLLETAAFAGIPVGLRILRVSGRLRIFFFTWGDNSNLLTKRLGALQGYLESSLPHFNIRLIPKLPYLPTPPKRYGVAQLAGEPSKDPECAGVTALCEAMLAAPKDIDIAYQVFATPIKPSRLDHWFTRRRHKSAAKKAGATLTEQQRSLISLGIQGQLSFPNTDLEAKLKAERLERELRRLQAGRSLALRVTSLCWYNRSNPLGGKELEYTAQHYLKILGGTIKPVERKYGFRVKRLWGFTSRPLSRLLRGNPTGQATLLLPEEAAPYFSLPRCDVGIRVTDHQSFSTTTETPAPLPEVVVTNSGSNPQTRPSREGIVIGRLYRTGKQLSENLTLLKNELLMHLAIFGNTGSGKTNTALLIVRRLWEQYKIPFLVIVPSKTEWRRLRNYIPNLHIFTAGDRRTAPFFFNFFNVPEGVSLLVHISNITQCFLAHWPCYGIMESHIQEIFWKVYKRCGWNLETEERGRPILLQDLYQTMQEFTQTLEYDGRLKQDFIGAYVSRIRALINNPNLANMFNVEQGLSIPELLSHPTILELSRLPDKEKALIASLVATSIAEYLEARQANQTQTTEGLRHLLVLEEAHHILKRLTTGTSIGEGNASQQEAINSLVALLREARAYGLGIFLIDQLPGTLAEAAVSLPGTTIIHSLKSARERRLVGEQANCDEDQIRQIGTMRRGEAIIHISFRGHPYNVQVDKFPTSPQATVWTDEKVAQDMERIYQERPHLKAQPVPDLDQTTPPTPSSTTPAEEELDWKPDPAILRKITADIDQPEFREKHLQLLDQALETRTPQPLTQATDRLRALIAKHVTNPQEQKHYCKATLCYLQDTLHQPRHAHLTGDLLFTLNDQTHPLETTSHAG